MLMNDDTVVEKQWYKEPWLWFVLSPMILVVCASMVTVTIAFKFAADVVSDNYYKEGRMLSKETTSEDYAKTMGIVGHLSFDAISGEVHLRIDGVSDEVSDEAEWIDLLVSHPAKAALDKKIRMKKVRAGSYRADMPAQMAGRWYLRLTAFQADQEVWRLNGELEFAKRAAEPFSASSSIPSKVTVILE